MDVALSSGRRGRADPPAAGSASSDWSRSATRALTARLDDADPIRGDPAWRTGVGAPEDNDRVPAPRLPARASALDPAVASRLKRDVAGLVVAVVQQHGTGEVLMVGWMDDEALHRTLTTGRATYWSRSRQAYWVKGETSGHRQWVREVRLDCDGDALLVTVDQEGPACHTGDRTCFDSDVLLAGAGA